VAFLPTEAKNVKDLMEKLVLHWMVVLHLHTAQGTDVLYELPKIYNAFVAGGARILGFDTNEIQANGRQSPATQYIGTTEGRD
jgi:hypothetical protein